MGIPLIVVGAVFACARLRSCRLCLSLPLGGKLILEILDIVVRVVLKGRLRGDMLRCRRMARRLLRPVADEARTDHDRTRPRGRSRL